MTLNMILKMLPIKMILDLELTRNENEIKGPCLEFAS